MVKLMKVKTNTYGVFYKDGDKWRGPYMGDLFTKEDMLWGYDSVEDFLKDVARQRKRKVKLFNLMWKEVKL